jgi:hypothetical protein
LVGDIVAGAEMRSVSFRPAFIHRSQCLPSAQTPGRRAERWSGPTDYSHGWRVNASGMGILADAVMTR